jgi:hypothetical protein
MVDAKRDSPKQSWPFEICANRNMPRDRNRKTFSIPTSIGQEFIDQLRVDAVSRKYPTVRAYLEALITRGLRKDYDPKQKVLAPREVPRALHAEYPSSAWAIGPGALSHRTVKAVEALTDRIHAGEDCEALRVDLMSLRWEIGQHLLALRKDYDAEVEARDDRYYARYGKVDE